MVLMAEVLRRWAFMAERRAVGRGGYVEVVVLVEEVVGLGGRGIWMRGGKVVVVVVGEWEEREVVE